MSQHYYKLSQFQTNCVICCAYVTVIHVSLVIYFGVHLAAKPYLSICYKGLCGANMLKLMAANLWWHGSWLRHVMTKSDATWETTKWLAHVITCKYATCIAFANNIAWVLIHCEF